MLWCHSRHNNVALAGILCYVQLLSKVKEEEKVVYLCKQTMQAMTSHKRCGWEGISQQHWNTNKPSVSCPTSKLSSSCPTHMGGHYQVQWCRGVLQGSSDVVLKTVPALSVSCGSMTGKCGHVFQVKLLKTCNFSFICRFSMLLLAFWSFVLLVMWLGNVISPSGAISSAVPLTWGGGWGGSAS